MGPAQIVLIQTHNVFIGRSLGRREDIARGFRLLPFHHFTGLGPGAAEQLRFIRAHEEARGEQFSDEGGLVAKLWAKTQVGAMRGLETFSQLVTYEYGKRECEGATQRQAPVAQGGVEAECGRGYVIRNAPWLIIDSPRFQHREVLVDSARHFLPLPTLKGLKILKCQCPSMLTR